MKDPNAPAVKVNLAIDHLLGAALFARHAHQLQTRRTPPLTEAEIPACLHYATAAVFSSVAFLECSINELFEAAIDRTPDVFGRLDPKLPALMEQVWPIVEMAPVLRKYEAVLTLAGAEPFGRGNAPYQHTDHLVKLRNALTHYKAEWSTELDDHAKLEQRLAPCFPPNPFAPVNLPFIPLRCLGHGCAEWAVQTTIAFFTAFAGKVHLPFYLGRYEDQLSTRSNPAAG